MILWACAWGQTLTLDGSVSDDGPAYVLVPFEVPAGTAEVQVDHASTSGSVLDWGLRGPDGVMRGWGGGNREPVWITASDASRSYRPGIPTGTWEVVIGKARLDAAENPYTLAVTRLAVAEHADERAREPYAPATLATGSRWYAGDLHVHSLDSGDANASLDAIAELARERGLDFVVVTDHNTVSTLDFLSAAQRRHPDVLLVPGMEFTTYAGHMNAFGNTGPLDFLLGIGGASIENAMADARAAGGLVSINHPTLDLGGLCIGCAWEHGPLPVDAVEIQTGGLEPVGGLFTDAAIAFWESLLVDGRNPAAVGGSDDHSAGVDLSFQESPIGNPTTMVFADELSLAGILEGIRNARTVVKLQGPADPMLELRALPGEVEVTVTGDATHVRFVVDGVEGPAVEVTSDPFVHRAFVNMGYVRAEALLGGRRTVTSHVVALRALEPPVEDAGSCGCQSGSDALWGLWWLLIPAGYARGRAYRSAGGARPGRP